MLNNSRRFLLCKNPMAGTNDNRVFVLHVQYPIKLIAWVYQYENISEEKRNEIEKELFPDAVRTINPLADYSRLEYPTSAFCFRLVLIWPGGMWHKLTAEKLIKEFAFIIRQIAEGIRLI